MKLTPRLEGGSAVRLDAVMGEIQVDGSLGEFLKSGTLGDALRDKIRESLTFAVQKSSNLEEVLPAQVWPLVILGSVRFSDPGAGRPGSWTWTAALPYPASRRGRWRDNSRAAGVRGNSHPAGDRSPRPTGHPAEQDARNRIENGHRRHGAAQRERFPFESREGCIAAEKAGD